MRAGAQVGGRVAFGEPSGNPADFGVQRVQRGPRPQQPDHLQIMARAVRISRDLQRSVEIVAGVVAEAAGEDPDDAVGFAVEPDGAADRL